MSPRARKEILRSRLQSGFGARPLNFTVGVVTMRVVTAFLLAPLVAAMLFSCIGLWDVDYPGGLPEVFVTYPYAASGMLLLVVPAYFLLRHFNLVRWWSAVAAGVAFGLLFGAMKGPHSVQLLRGPFPMALIGAVAGLAFWRVCSPVTAPNSRWRVP